MPQQNDEGMDKYAVDETGNPEVLEKAAAQGCPNCGGHITRHGNIVSCENCGTAPFEKRK